jgi:hypothetical protein
MKYFAQPFYVQGNAYSRLTDSRRDNITVGLQSSARVSDRSSRQISTQESDDAFIQRIEDKISTKADKTIPKRGDLERSLFKSLKKVAKKTSQFLRKRSATTKRASKPKHVYWCGEYPQPYVFW